MSSALEEFDRLLRATKGPTLDQAADATIIREKARDILLYMETHVVASREKSLALTKLQEFVMWATAACMRDYSNE